MRWKVFALISMTALAFGLSYDPIVSGGVFLSSAVGYYLGGEMAVPTLLLMSKLGILDEEEIFSPFSTLAYDSIEIGREVGALSMALLMKAVLVGFEPSLLMDFVVGCIVINLTSTLEDHGIVPVSLGLTFGVIW